MLEGVISVENLVVILLWRLQIASLFIFAREYDLIPSPNIHNVHSVLAINELTLMNWIPHRHRTLHLKYLEVTITYGSLRVCLDLQISTMRSV